MAFGGLCDTPMLTSHLKRGTLRRTKGNIAMAIADSPQRTRHDRPLQHLLSFRLSRVQAKLNAQATKILKTNGGLTLVQWRILVMMQTIGETTVGQIARETQFDKALISRTAQTLVTQGLVEMRTGDKDHRKHMLTMTEAGQSVLDRAAPHMVARQDALRASMTEEQLSTLFQALDLLETAADQDIEV